ncbi:YjjW family glycine radical enzyme activase [Dethiothermospora halolimnae]|uniref:YjjW family glycine radical enzyme activase n=1 Tax=Dethiothermospora halolimnae TaxID=3114390 RepID=UPI003CCBE10A
MGKGLVNKIVPFSSVDGPGNRTAIFLQGCNFNCLYCHNPETINLCENCGLCVKECPYNALTVDNNKVKWNKNTCKECGKCIDICPRDSSPKIKEMSVEEVVEEIEKNKLFISGITVSGGECTLQSHFLIELFKEVKKMGLTTFIDTNGTVSLYENDKLMKVTDMVMVDMKSFDVGEHKKLTGKSNKIVIDNIRYLADIGKLYEIRTVIVPEVLDNYNNVDNISKLLASLDSEIRYKLIKYRPVGVRKDMIGSHTPSDDMMNKLENVAKYNGCIDVIIV